MKSKKITNGGEKALRSGQTSGKPYLYIKGTLSQWFHWRGTMTFQMSRLLIAKLSLQRNMVFMDLCTFTIGMKAE